MGFLSNIFDPGKQDRERASGLADQGIFTGGNVSGPGGISAGFDFSGGQVTGNLGLGSFDPLLSGFQGLSQFGIDQAQGGLPPGLEQLGESTIDRLGQTNIDQFSNQGGVAGLQQLFGSSLKTATADPFDLGADISSRLASLASRRENRLVNKTFDRLKRSGKLGTTGGAGIAGELDLNLKDAALQRDLAGLQFGRQVQGDARGALFGAFGGLEQSGARTFGESFAQEQLGGNRSLQQFGVGQGLLQSFLANQAGGANLAQGGAATAGGIAQLPLAFQQALLASGGAASSTLFSAAGVNQTNAQLAKSPFLEALNAAGSFASAIKPNAPAT